MPDFGKGEDVRKPRYSGFTTRSLSLSMRGGVKLAVDILLPKRLPHDVKVPALIIQTRYWRANNVRPPFKWFQKLTTPMPELTEVFAASGYALVFVDVRGTGASSGVWLHPWAKDEVMDGREVVDWICSQPWSNGRVGAIGTSYVGTAAEFIAVNNHPAMKAVVPRFSIFDAYLFFSPGGIKSDWFLKGWALMTSSLDRNEPKGQVPLLSQLMKENDATLKMVEHPRGFHTFNDPRSLGVGRLVLSGVKPVDLDKDHILLKEAVQEHERNGDVYAMSRGWVYRDETMTFGQHEIPVDGISPHAFKEDIERSGVAIYSWSGWFDGAFADDVIGRFLTFKNPQQAVIGPWGHGGLFHASPYKPLGTPVDPSVKAQFLECLKFFERHLRNTGNGSSEKNLIYYTMGEEKWKSTAVWPPADVIVERWFLSADHMLSKAKPSVEHAADSYVVDFEATTGKTNRWHTLLGGFAVIYPDRSEEDTRLLTYTQCPYDEETSTNLNGGMIHFCGDASHQQGNFLDMLHLKCMDVQLMGKIPTLKESRAKLAGKICVTCYDSAPENPQECHSQVLLTLSSGTDLF